MINIGGPKNTQYYEALNKPCYYCIANSSAFEKEKNNTKLNEQNTAYYNALARERYVAQK